MAFLQQVLLSLLCVAGLPVASAYLSFDALKDAFSSPNGLMVSVADPSVQAATGQSSMTVWRNDLPLTLFNLPREIESDTAGIIMEPDKVHVLCSYAVNGNTDVRQDGSGQKDKCGVIGGGYKLFTVGNMGGKCASEWTATDFASAYFYKPMVTLDVFGITLWALEYNVCHFEEVPRTLDAQKALLEAMWAKPPGMSKAEALGNATKLGAGLTTYNEIVIAPYEAEAVGGLFWAHYGGFRMPRVTDQGAMRIACRLNETALPYSDVSIFEFAGVNLERPFQGCEPHPSMDCLSNGLTEWKQNMTGGARDAASVFRPIDPSHFVNLLTNASQEACAPFAQSYVASTPGLHELVPATAPSSPVQPETPGQPKTLLL